jgi:hypothetical protein
MAITINGTGTITGLTAGGLPDGSITSADLASGAITAGALPAGSILQVKSTVYQTFTSQSITATSFVAMPFNVTITPSSTNSKILVSSSLMGQWSASSGHNSMFTFNRKIGSTDNYIFPTSTTNKGLVGCYSKNDSDAGSSVDGFVISNYLDEPNTTSEITYIPVLRGGSATFTWYINQNATAGSSADYERGMSWITVMEVAG